MKSLYNKKEYKKKISALINLVDGFWCIAIKGRHWAQFKHWYGEWWKPLYWN